MPLMKSLFTNFKQVLAILIVMTIASCVPTATEKKAACGTGFAFDTVSRSCYSVTPVKKVPVGNAPAVTMSEEVPKTVTLSYTDANLDQATSCEVSSTSSNIQAVSPLVTNGGLTAQALLVYSAASSLANLIPSGANSVTALNNSTAMFTALTKFRTSFYYPTIVTQVGVFKVNAAAIVGIGSIYIGDATIKHYYDLTQAELVKLTPMITQVGNSCQCSAGICSTVIVPKLNKNGAAGFSYTVTDKDGTSTAKAVSVSIAAMAATTTHLKPVAESSYLSPTSLPFGIYPVGYFNESSTSTPTGYDVNLSGAGDISGTAASSMRYYFSGSKNGSNQGITPNNGRVTNCMDLSGSSGLNDTSCTYTPASGDAFDSTTPAAASVLVGDLTYTAKSEGTYGNSLTVQYFNLQSDNTSVDSYITASEKYGLVESSDSFIRVVGNAIKIFINPNLTSSNDIQTLVNAHPQASRLVTVSGATPSPYVFPTPSVATPAAINLSGGVNGFDTIPYYANNLSTNSSNTATAMLRILSDNDVPMVPKTYNSLFAQTETFVEETAKTVTLGFTDVDDSGGFTVTAKIEALACTTNTEAVMTTYMSTLVTSTSFTIGAPGAFSCASGVCTVPVLITPGSNFAGNACLYYTVTDVGAETSYVQGVNIVVTNVNDIPQISLAALPTITALGSASTNEDLAPALNSYTSIYVGPGDSVWEASQKLTVTATSSNTTLLPNTACTNYTTVTSSPIGSVTPSSVGLKYFDTTNLRCYVSTGTASSANWALYPSLTVYPVCAFDYSGNGSPVGAVTPSAANKLYLDKTNNKCYKSASTSSSSWAQDTTLSNYKIAYVPVADKSGTANITVTATDDGGTTNSGIDTASDILALTVNSIDDEPVYLSTITAIHTNEGGAVQSGAFSVDEDAASTADEDAQGITITSITTDNAAVLPVSAITIFYDLNDNGVKDSGEARAIGALLENSIGDPANEHSFYLMLDPVDGVSGNANIQMTITDGNTPKVTNFSFIVHPVAALHGGWTNISSVGLKTDKTGAPVSSAEIQCNYNKVADTENCSGGTNANCTGLVSPNSTITPSAANVIYWDSQSLRCYRSTGTTAFSWVEMNTSCPISRTVGSCSDNNCITSATPVGVTTPSFVDQYLYNSVTNTCYVSTGTTNTDWITYVPSKVTLSWKPFVMVGSGPDSAVQIGGWNVYRREAGYDYNFLGGHLKNTSSTTTYTITDPTVRTFTDTTAIAGKTYYYVVRPVDTIRKYPTYTPETFSEVRIMAPPANYSFVHRWMVNQEICNGMNITTTTSPNAIDQTRNFRCPYTGPGQNAGYYDYGKDLLVDTQELGCAYAVAPKCSANGCIGIGAPAVTGSPLAADDLYYDRSAGTCYRYDGAAWATLEASAISASLANNFRSALNAPLVNVTQSKAVAICSARAAPTGTSVTFSTANALLPNKKDYTAYAAQKTTITDPEVTEMEQGFSLNIQSRCNGSSASGLDTAFTDSSIPSTSFIYSLPGTFSSGIRSLYTGSVAWGSSKGTEACISRFGIQDLYGNVAEWTQDQMTCTAGATYNECTAVVGGNSSFTATDFDASTYGFNSRTGPYNDINANKVVDLGDGLLTNWTFADELFGAGKFAYPVGMPIDQDINTTHVGDAFLTYILDIGPSNGITTNKLHEDGIIVNNASLSGATGSFAVGGSYLSGNRAGRFSSELVISTGARVDIGLRCVIPIATGDYVPDSSHTYSY